MNDQKPDYAKLWEQFKAFLKAEIGWYETYNYRPMTGQEFVDEYGEKMSAEFKAFMIENVQVVNRQCDNYAIYFTGEEIIEG
jgi:hypothetical protein